MGAPFKLTVSRLSMCVLCAFLFGCGNNKQDSTAPPDGTKLFTPSTGTTKTNALSVIDEKQLVSVVKSKKTNDGSTVDEVLKYAEKNSNGKFKVASIEVGYSGAGPVKSVPEVMICYWIGASRKEGDQYCNLSYEISSDHKSARPDGSYSERLNGGEISFLSLINEINE